MYASENGSEMRHLRLPIFYPKHSALCASEKNGTTEVPSGLCHQLCDTVAWFVSHRYAGSPMCPHLCHAQCVGWVECICPQGTSCHWDAVWCCMPRVLSLVWDLLRDDVCHLGVTLGLWLPSPGGCKCVWGLCTPGLAPNRWAGALGGRDCVKGGVWCLLGSASPGGRR